MSEDAFYRGINTAALIAAQAVPRDPRFLMDSEFQEPREIRLGLRFIFWAGSTPEPRETQGGQGLAGSCPR